MRQKFLYQEFKLIKLKAVHSKDRMLPYAGCSSLGSLVSHNQREDIASSLCCNLVHAEVRNLNRQGHEV